MKKILLLLLFNTFLSFVANAQLWKLRRYEATASLGTTQFYGDVGGFTKGENLLGIKDFSFKQTWFNFTTSFRYRVLDNVSTRLNFAFGGFHCTDARGSNVQRGLEATTTFLEPSLLGEYYFIKNKGENSFLHLRDYNHKFASILSAFDIYAFAGFGGLSYKVNPNDKLASKITNQKGFVPIIPVGAGFTMFYDRNINFGVELGGRYTFSDNLDGYTSIYSKSKDVYHFLNFTVTYKIKTGENGLPKFSR
jgi:hypothetical protein